MVEPRSLGEARSGSLPLNQVPNCGPMSKNPPPSSHDSKTWAGNCYVFHFARNVVLPSGKVVAFAYFVRAIEALHHRFYSMVEAKRYLAHSLWCRCLSQVVKRIICLHKVAFVKSLPVPFFAAVS
ncbi:hypothetical protein CGCF413_v006465 [Colletotrichum fructicola]|nr:hypothetical protein CGCF413_v006465 [Colletotrichum fructicola]